MVARRLTCALLVFSLAFPCYAYAEEVSYGRQDEQGAVSVSSSEGQGEEGPSAEVGSSGSNPSDSVSSLVQDEGSDSSLVEPISVQPLAAAGNESQLLTTLAYILGYNVNTNTGSFGSNIQVTYGISATGSGILSYINTGNTRLSQISSTLSSISSLLADVNISTSSLVSSLRNSAGSAIQALQLISSRLVSADMTAAQWLNRISGFTGNIRDSLSYDGMTVSMWLARVSGFLDDVRSDLNSGDLSAANWLQNVSSMLSYDDMNVSQWLARVSGFLDDVRSDLNSGDLSAANWLQNVSSKLSYDDMNVSQWLARVSGFLNDVRDSLFFGSSSVSDVAASGFSSIVNAIERLIETVEGLELSTEVSPEVTVNVEDQKEQGLNLLDALLGVLDVAAIGSSLSTLSSTLENSFPFGALFMVASALAVLSASPVAPSFSGVVSGVPIDIDLSTFDSLAALCRALLLVLYVIGLYHATRDWVFHSGGGDS